MNQFRVVAQLFQARDRADDGQSCLMPARPGDLQMNLFTLLLYGQHHMVNESTMPKLPRVPQVRCIWLVRNILSYKC